MKVVCLRETYFFSYVLYIKSIGETTNLSTNLTTLYSYFGLQLKLSYSTPSKCSASFKSIIPSAKTKSVMSNAAASDNKE